LRRHDHDAVAHRGGIDLGSAAAVVNDDHLVDVQGVEQASERLAGAIGDDDDTDGQCAVRTAITTRIVRGNIEMSNQIASFPDGKSSDLCDPPIGDTLADGVSGVRRPSAQCLDI
jgi:hypothetical protein